MENQKVNSFANRAQPSSHKLSGDATGMVLLEGDPLPMDTHTHTHTLYRQFSAVLIDESKFWITLWTCKHERGTIMKVVRRGKKLFFPR